MILKACMCMYFVHLQKQSTDYCLSNAFVSVSHSFLIRRELCGVPAHLWFHQLKFNDIRVDSNTYGNLEQTLQSKNLYRFCCCCFGFIRLSSHCYHFIIRPMNNKNKLLMLCFTWLSIEYWIGVPLNWCFCCCCLPIEPIQCELKPQSEFQKLGKKRWRWRKKSSTCWTF